MAHGIERIHNLEILTGGKRHENEWTIERDFYWQTEIIAHARIETLDRYRPLHLRKLFKRPLGPPQKQKEFLLQPRQTLDYDEGHGRGLTCPALQVILHRGPCHRALHVQSTKRHQHCSTYLENKEDLPIVDRPAPRLQGESNVFECLRYRK